MNLAHFLANTALRIPNHTAIRFGAAALTFDEMNQRVDSLAHGFTQLGVRAGDFCILMMPSSINWTLVYYALAKMGAVVVPVNFLYRKGELAFMMRDCGARVFIGHSDYLEEVIPVLDELPHVELRIAEGADLPQGFLPIDEVFSPQGPFETCHTDADDPFAIIYTSGTTGQPKGAVLTHRSLMCDAQAVAGIRRFEPHDIVLSVLPLFHIYGQTHALNISIYLGLTIRMWVSFDAVKVREAIEEEKSTIFYGVPTMINRLVELASTSPLTRSSLRFCISGGASLPVEVLHRFEKQYQAKIYESYGLTEFSPTCIENPFGKPPRPGSIGLPIPGFKVRIVDENDADVGVNEVGELLVSGSAMMKGYLNQPEASAAAMRGGWLHTGDLARMDDDGYIYIVDRKKEMIIRGGYNIYPREIEEIIYSLEGIEEAAVFGIPHEDLGEEIAAAVVLRSGNTLSTNELQKFIKERVAPYKYPRVIEFMDELPKTAAGKIFKRGIRLTHVHQG